MRHDPSSRCVRLGQPCCASSEPGSLALRRSQEKILNGAHEYERISVNTIVHWHSRSGMCLNMPPRWATASEPMRAGPPAGALAGLLANAELRHALASAGPTDRYQCLEVFHGRRVQEVPLVTCERVAYWRQPDVGGRQADGPARRRPG